MESRREPLEADGGRIAVVAMAATLGWTSIVEWAVTLFASGGPEPMRGPIIRFSGWLLAIGFSIISLVVGSMKWRAIPVLAAVAATLYLMIGFFRGTWVWYGTFDAYWYSKSTWVLPCTLLTLVGVLVGSRYIKQPNVTRKLCWLSVALLMVAALVSWITANSFSQQIDSIYAPTRPVGLFAIAVILAIGCGLESRP